MATSKFPKGFNRMTLTEQETILVKKLQELYLIETQITKALASVRGGYKYKVSEEITRPDEALLKL